MTYLAAAYVAAGVLLGGYFLGLVLSIRKVNSQLLKNKRVTLSA